MSRSVVVLNPIETLASDEAGNSITLEDRGTKSPVIDRDTSRKLQRVIELLTSIDERLARMESE